MKTICNTLLLVLSICLFLNCSNDNGTNAENDTENDTENEDQNGNEDENPTESSVTIEYTESTADFANPDRGFYRYSETRASNYTVLSEEELKTYSSPSTSSGATYQTISTLVFRYYILDGLTTGTIPQSFLDNMQLDFDAARNAGVKLIPRFTYTVSSNSGSCSEGFICPPYGDASKSVVQAQIEQLGTVLTANSDVITAIQMGFIGTWGENYYTDYFGDASSNDTQGKLLDENWTDRIAVLQALLDATPKELMIQVRYPQMKQRFVYGINATTDVAPLTNAEAFTSSDKARIGFHNDCLFASADDFGTYQDYGNTATSSTTDITNLKPYFADDSNYVIVGGETCNDSYSPENDCSPTGIADTDLRTLHYTYLNADYNNEVNNDWVDGGCMEDIKRNLGYRFVLKNAEFPEEVTAGNTINLTINLENIGYASPSKERNVKLILRNTADATLTEFKIDTDIRFWFSSVSLSGEFETEASMPKGDYEVLLLLQDTHESIKDRIEYSIRFANDDVWEENTGFNKLNHRITII
ncbi:DUF4832 domain-containing protein [Aquimarina pacifica]|uniref:DUF4832 domain-containing protein n=1 Tax=Aquimarina pacifica TaxID=1296415 RepID=UPI0004B61CFF|nr:DUF4832 domain-containing protein [Aquimarina pacifica]